MSPRWRSGSIRFLALLSAVLVVVGTYLEWPAFGPFYDGPIPGGFPTPHIDSGYQLLDLPIVLAALVGSGALLRNWRGRRAGRLGLWAGIAAILFTLLYSMTEPAGYFQLAWGYYVTLAGGGLLSATGWLRHVSDRRMYPEHDRPEYASDADQDPYRRGR